MSNQKIYFVDVGVEHINIVALAQDGSGELKEINRFLLTNNDSLENLLDTNNLWSELTDSNNLPLVYATGKLSSTFIKKIGSGQEISPAASFWSAALFLINRETDHSINSLGLVDLSASGYLVIAVNKNGELINDALIVNPRCGAGSGTNIARILQKLDIRKDQVDEILKDYLGEENKA